MFSLKLTSVGDKTVMSKLLGLGIMRWMICVLGDNGRYLRVGASWILLRLCAIVTPEFSYSPSIGGLKGTDYDSGQNLSVFRLPLREQCVEV